MYNKTNTMFKGRYGTEHAMKWGVKHWCYETWASPKGVAIRCKDPMTFLGLAHIKVRVVQFKRIDGTTRPTGCKHPVGGAPYRDFWVHV